MIKEATNNSSNARRRIAIYVKQGGVDAIIGDEESSRLSSVAVDRSITAPQKILEEAIYINPGLLDDYAQIDILADTRRFVITPHQPDVDEKSTEAMIAQLWPDIDADSAVSETCSFSISVTSLFDKTLKNFIVRTFPSARIHHRIASLINYFSTLSRPVNKMKLYAHLDGDTRLDIIVLAADRLIMANSFDCSETIDALYFIMAVIKDCGFDALDDEVIVCGNPDRCTVLTGQLRAYINSVMPLLLPAPQSETPTELLFYYNK